MQTVLHRYYYFFDDIQCVVQHILGGLERGEDRQAVGAGMRAAFNEQR